MPVQGGPWATSALLTLCSCSLRVAEELLVANLLLLKHLLAPLQHTGHNAATSRETSSNPAICLGPHLLSPASRMRPPIERVDRADGEGVSGPTSCSLLVPPEFGCSEVPGSLLSPTYASGETAGRTAPHPQPYVQEAASQIFRHLG